MPQVLVAALSAFLRKQPPVLQALFVGACGGAFLMGVISASDPDPPAGVLVAAFLAFGFANGAVYLVAQRHSSRQAGDQSGEAVESGSGLPSYELILFVMLWLVGIGAATLTLIVGAGFTVAVILVLPIVLFAPIAVDAGRELAARRKP